MSGRLPALKGREIIAALRKAGFVDVRRSAGSHVHLAHPDGRRVTVPAGYAGTLMCGRSLPDHGPTDVGRGLLRRILRDADLPPDEFRSLL